MSRSHPKSFVFTMLLVLVVGGVALAKKPPKDPPPPEPDPAPAPVKYQIVWVDPIEPGQEARLYDINDSLTAVGSLSGEGPVIVDVSPGSPGTSTLHLLEDLVAMPEEWACLCSAIKINNGGLVFGSFYYSSDSSLSGYYVCDTTGIPPYPIQELPLGGRVGVRVANINMNEWGDVLFSPQTNPLKVALRNVDDTYEAVGLPPEIVSAAGINDATADHPVQVVGELATGEGVVYQLELIDGVLTFVHVRTFDSHAGVGGVPWMDRTINDSGLVAHALEIVGPKIRGKREITWLAAQYDVNTDTSEIITDLPESESIDINSVGQICGHWDGNSKGFIYDPLEDESWSLDDLVYAEDPEDDALWFAESRRRPIAITNPSPDAGFPAIVGNTYGIDRAFILLPEPADPQ